MLMLRSIWHRWRVLLAILLAALLMAAIPGAAILLVRTQPGPAADLYPYPPNARQLIALGLTGQPGARAQGVPVAVDRVLVDGTQTVVQFHLAAQESGRPVSLPQIVLRDDTGQSYQEREGGIGGGALAPDRMGFLSGLLAAFGPAANERGFAAFASLPAGTHTAILRIAYGSRIQFLRVPLNLAALRRIPSVRLPPTVSALGVSVRITGLARVATSEQIDYSVDLPPLTGLPRIRNALYGAGGGRVWPTAGQMTCNPRQQPAGQPRYRIRCALSWSFPAVPAGTPLAVAVSLAPSRARFGAKSLGVLARHIWTVRMVTP